MTARSSFLTRRNVVTGGTALIGGGLIAGCSSGIKGSAAATSPSATGAITIGWIHPLTGSLASFGSADDFVLQKIRATSQYKNGFRIGGKTYDVVIKSYDSQSDPTHAGDLAHQAILADNVDLLVTSSTPETVDPVASAAEALGTPCVCTDVPWESWYVNLNGNPAHPTMQPRYVTLFFFGVEELAGCYIPMWRRIPTDKVVGAAFPNDSDGNAFRAVWPGFAKAAGYTMIDPPPYTDGTTNYATLIATFKAAGCQLFTNVSLPPDFSVMWKQFAQLGFRPRLATVGKDLLFPSDAYALGSLVENIALNARWTPALPYASSLTGETCAQYAADFENAGNGQWIQSMGGSYSLFEVAYHAFMSVSDPHDKEEMAAAIHNVNFTAMAGPLNFTSAKNPAPGVTIIYPVGVQWQKGTKYPYELFVVDNTLNAKVPIQAPLQPTNPG
jgi:branched-chain amino acid transport system substrate-binding protein